MSFAKKQRKNVKTHQTRKERQKKSRIFNDDDGCTTYCFFKHVIGQKLFAFPL